MNHHQQSKIKNSRCCSWLWLAAACFKTPMCSSENRVLRHAAAAHACLGEGGGGLGQGGGVREWGPSSLRLAPNDMQCNENRCNHLVLIRSGLSQSWIQNLNWN